MSQDHPLQQLVRKLRTRTALDESDAQAVLALPFAIRTYDASAHIVREGSTALRYCSFIRSGFAIRHKLTKDGRRQIVAINLPGDFLDLQHLFLSHADHNVQALTRMEAVDLDRLGLEQLALDRPGIGRALWTDALVEASIHREWILNVGRRDARQRIAHLLCEFAVRMKAADVDAGGYVLPMTQEQLGDTVGLTSVHVNRTLKALEAEGVLQRDKRHISFRNWETIREIGDFNPLYLHLDQATAS